VKHVRLINAALIILLLSETYAGSIHDKRMADAAPYPLPAGSRWLQDLGVLALTLPQVEVIDSLQHPACGDARRPLPVCATDPGGVYLKA
jgi:hypothetical protein